MARILLRQGLIDGRRQDLAIRDGRIDRIAPAIDPAGCDVLDVTDRLILPGFVESHIHPDKAFITVNPARAIGLEGYGLAEGCRADLVVLEARDAAQAITEQAEKLLVIKDGRVVARSTRTTELPGQPVGPLQG